MDVSPQMQDKLAQFQTLQQQLQMTSMQKQQLMLHGSDIENALNELGKTGGESKIYKAAGMLLIETSRDESEKGLKEEKELNDTRLKVMERQEKKLAEKYEELRGELKSMLGSSAGAESG